MFINISFWGGSWVQNGGNFGSMKIDFLLEYSFVFLWGILVLVGGLLLCVVDTKYLNKAYFEVPVLELVWTLLPGVVLILIAVPSLEVLYFIENKTPQDLTLKVTGHQWYWSYDYLNKICFDSYLESSNMSSPRVLEVDNHTILPLGKISATITSEDVLHSWSLPSVGIKTDANPGRLNSSSFNLFLPGLYYGHCSEICGANHSFMPIVVESVVFSLFKQWATMSSE